MMKIFVIHNNESDRLAYLMPRLSHLIAGLKTAGTSASLQLVGPDVDLIAENRVEDNRSNRFLRFIEAGLMYYFAAVQDPRGALRKEYLRAFEALFSYRRSIRIEQEVLYAHAFCWREITRCREPAIILESDAIANDHTLTGLLATLDYLQSPSRATEKYYVDLAGGCDRNHILNSWCFNDEYGCIDIEIVVGKQKLILHKLPRLTTNTVGGYLVSPSLAADFMSFVQNVRPMLPPDWALNRFASRLAQDEVLCIHTSPALFMQGSSVGAYQSSIDMRSFGEHGLGKSYD
jgi:hypothetical protein